MADPCDAEPPWPISPTAPLRRRWIWRALAALGALLALVVVAVLVILGNLERPWVKTRLQALARSSAGVEVDYAEARVRLLGGASLAGLVVRSHDGELVRAGAVEAEWSLSGARIRDARLRDVVVTLVAHDDATPSPSPQPEPVAAKPEPLSQLIAARLGSAPPIDRLSIENVTLIVLRPRERLELRGLGVQVQTRPWRVALGSASAPLDLRLDRRLDGAAAGSAQARLSLSLSASASQIDAALEARLIKQTLAAAAGAVDRLIALEATARFDPRAGTSGFTGSHGQLADGAASFEAQVTLPDAAAPLVRHAHGELDLLRLLALVPPGCLPLTLSARTASLHDRRAVSGRGAAAGRARRGERRGRGGRPGAAGREDRRRSRPRARAPRAAGLDRRGRAALRHGEPAGRGAARRPRAAARALASRSIRRRRWPRAASSS